MSISENIFMLSIAEIHNGVSVKDIKEKYHITEDQAKKISQIAKMYNAIASLDNLLQEKFIKLGFKALVLSPLFKNNDIDGIKEILESITLDIKRDDLKLLPAALEEKREKLKQAKQDAEYMFNELKALEQETEERIKELEENKRKIDESMAFLNDMTDKKAKEFLMEHLGVAKGNVVLYKRLDISWQQSLKQKGVIRYDSTAYVWVIKDLDELKRQTERRVKNKNNMYYDPNKASGLYSNYYPDDPVYKKASGMDASILEAVKYNENKIKELKRKKREINRSLKELKSTKVQNYMDASEVSNHLSQYHIIEHRRLQNSGLRYLYNKELVVTTELAKDNYRFDVIGYDREGQITIIEAKASIEDFRSDDKFHKYLNYCNSLYFIFNQDTYKYYKNEINNKLAPYNIGVLIGNKDNAVLENIASINHLNKEVKDDVVFLVNRILSRRFIYGR